jgi:uncharacterized protein YjiS (DUF1127 family)
MATAITAVNLCHQGAAPRQGGQWLRLLLRLEAWLDARASRRVLYLMDERALADIGLTRFDLDREDPASSWQSLLPPMLRP